MRDQVDTNKRSLVWEPEEALYSPFGRPGCGAPMKDTEGRIVAVYQGKLRDVSIHCLLIVRFTFLRMIGTLYCSLGLECLQVHQI